MSYKCQICNETCYHKELKIIDTIRNVTYNRNILKFNRETKKKEPIYIDSSKGWEIVKEYKLCQKCYDERKDNTKELDAKEKTTDYIFTQRNMDERERARDNRLNGAREGSDKPQEDTYGYN